MAEILNKTGPIVLTSPGDSDSGCCGHEPAPRDRTANGTGLGRWRIFGVFSVAVAASLYLGWPWLVAAGLAPFILAMAPCAVMCSVGLCAMGGKKAAAPLVPTKAGSRLAK